MHDQPCPSANFASRGVETVSAAKRVVQSSSARHLPVEGFVVVVFFEPWAENVDAEVEYHRLHK